MNIPNFRGCERREIVEVTVKEGEGTPEDLVREVHYFFDEEDKLLFKIDPKEDLI